MRVPFVFAILALPALLSPLTARGQEVELPSFSLDRLDVDSTGVGSLSVGTGEFLPVGALRFSLTGHYENDPLVVVTGDTVQELVADRYSLHLVAAWVPLSGVQFGAEIPIVASQTGLDLRDAGIPIPARVGMGTPTVAARLGLLSQRAGAWFDAALQVGVRPPLGTDGTWLQDERWGIAPKLMVGRNLGAIRAGLEVGLRWLPGVDDLGSAGLDAIGDHVQLAGVLVSGPADGLRAELSARTIVAFDGRMGAVQVLGGLRYPTPWGEAFAIAGPGLGQQRAGDADFRVLLGTVFGAGGGFSAMGGEVPEVGPDGEAFSPDDMPWEGPPADVSNDDMGDTAPPPAGDPAGGSGG